MPDSKKILPVLMMLCFLAGCSSMNGQFDCPMKNGVRCESLDRVNQRIDRGEIGQDDGMNGREHEVTATSMEDGVWKGMAAGPLRHTETVQHVWVAPWEDANGNYHGASHVYAVVKPGYWRGHPPKQTDREEG